MEFDRGSANKQGSPTIESDTASANIVRGGRWELDGGSFTPITGSPPITFVQQKPGTTADASGNFDITFDTPLTVGKSVIACISIDDAAVIDVSPVLLGGGGATLTSAISISNTGTRSLIYYKHNVSGGETGIRFSLSTIRRANINASVWGGLANTPPFASTSNFGAGGTFTTLDIDTAENPGCLAIGMVAVDQDTLSSSEGGDLNIPLTNVGGANVWQAAGYVIGLTQNSVQGTWNRQVFPANFTACIVGFNKA